MGPRLLADPSGNLFSVFKGLYSVIIGWFLLKYDEVQKVKRFRAYGPHGYILNLQSSVSSNTFKILL